MLQDGKQNMKYISFAFFFLLHTCLHASSLDDHLPVFPYSSPPPKDKHQDDNQLRVAIAENRLLDTLGKQKDDSERTRFIHYVRTATRLPMIWNSETMLILMTLTNLSESDFNNLNRDLDTLDINAIRCAPHRRTDTPTKESNSAENRPPFQSYSLLVACFKCFRNSDTVRRLLSLGVDAQRAWDPETGKNCLHFALARPLSMEMKNTVYTLMNSMDPDRAMKLLISNHKKTIRDENGSISCRCERGQTPVMQFENDVCVFSVELAQAGLKRNTKKRRNHVNSKGESLTNSVKVCKLFNAVRSRAKDCVPFFLWDKRDLDTTEWGITAVGFLDFDS